MSTLPNLGKICILNRPQCTANLFNGFYREHLSFHTSYLNDSYISFTLKMESVSKNTIFGLKMTVKSGLEKIFLKFLHAGDYFPLLHKSVQNHKFSNK